MHPSTIYDKKNLNGVVVLMWVDPICNLSLS